MAGSPRILTIILSAAIVLAGCTQNDDRDAESKSKAASTPSSTPSPTTPPGASAGGESPSSTDSPAGAPPSGGSGAAEGGAPGGATGKTPAKVEIVALDGPDERVPAGSPTTLYATVTNDGDTDGEASLALTVSGNVRTSRTVKVLAHTGIVVPLVDTPTRAGAWEYKLGTHVFLVNVYDPPTCSVSTRGTLPASAKVGDRVVVDGEIGNSGDADTACVATLYANGIGVAGDTFAVPAYATRLFSLSFEPSSAGDYAMSLNGQAPWTLTVGARSEHRIVRVESWQAAKSAHLPDVPRPNPAVLAGETVAITYVIPNMNDYDVPIDVPVFLSGRLIRTDHHVVPALQGLSYSVRVTFDDSGPQQLVVGTIEGLVDVLVPMPGVLKAEYTDRWCTDSSWMTVTVRNDGDAPMTGISYRLEGVSWSEFRFADSPSPEALARLDPGQANRYDFMVTVDDSCGFDDEYNIVFVMETPMHSWAWDIVIVT